MTIVRILPEILSNQIAAGEVVQRPSSVVKELVENSIDAKATTITIEVVRGGKSLIRVSDNGVGLLRDDALLSIERYATSKIFTKEDLFSISTMGFRGEALPSIASVSKFTLVTRTKDSDIGTRIEINGGKTVNVSDAGAPVGTMVEVKYLFFNTPARKKFLKTDNTETSHIADAISGMALGNSHIQFRLFLNNRLQKNFSSSDDLFQRSVNVLGKDVAKKLYKIKYSDDYIEIRGFAGHPLIFRSSSSKIFLFVNNRLIYDRGLMSAIFQGYKGRIMKGRFPLAVVFINIGFDQVDVNVHPSKREVKFFRAQQVYQAVARAVEKALLVAQENVIDYSKPAAIKPKQPPFSSQGHFETDNSGELPKVEQSVFNWQTTPVEKEKKIALEQTLQQKVSQNPTPNLIHSNSKLKIQNSKFKVIGQVMGTYILVESRDGLILIDQHAAHEKIIYESLIKRHQSLSVISQDLVVPETMELDFRESDILETFLDELHSLGFHIEHFGGTTFVIKAIPSIIDEKEIKPVIMEIVEKALTDQNRFSKAKWLEECLILMSCHNAIKANKNMNIMEMEMLLKDLEECDNPMHCPHGRPVQVTFSKDELEKLFKRVV